MGIPLLPGQDANGNNLETNPNNSAGNPIPNETPEQAAARQQAEAAAKADAARAAAYNAHFQYGDNPGGAQEAAGRYANYGLMGQGRAAPQIDRSQTEWDRMNSAYARNNQNDAMAMMSARAHGHVPSIAQMQADRQMRQASAEQSSAAASARGPAALALAQQGAAANTANMQSQISNQAQINGAVERQQAEQNYLGAATTMRQGDFAAGGLAAQQAQAQAQINLAKQGANDQYQLGMTQAEIDVRKAQLGAQGNQVGIESGAAQAAANRAQAGSQFDASRLDKYIGMGLGAVGTGAAIYGLNALGGSGSTPTAPGAGSVAGGDAGGYGTPGGSNPSNSAGDGYYDQSSGNWIHGDDPSDVTAKQNIRPAFAMGEQAGLATRGGDPRAAAWDEGHAQALADIQKLAKKSPEELRSYGDNPLAAAVRGLKADAWDEGRRGVPTQQAERDLASADASAGVDQGTAQLASGLAPSMYDYRQGVPGATPGTKFGPMAQNMAANPATATAVRQDPRTGLLGIDAKDGLKVALGGVGHLAQRQAETERQLARFREMAGNMGSVSPQESGLLGQSYGPSLGQSYLAAVRGYGR